MKEKLNFCGIFAEERLHLSKVQANLTLRSIGTFFATVFVTTTIILLASCSQDDDYYDSDMYTLAEMGTRLAEGGEDGDPGGGGISLPWLNAGSGDTIITATGLQHDLTFHISWGGQPYESAQATVRYTSATNRSSELFYMKSGIERSVHRYKFIKCEIDTYAHKDGEYFRTENVKVYYKKAHENPVDGTYGEEQYEFIPVELFIPRNLITEE